MSQGRTLAAIVCLIGGSQVLAAEPPPVLVAPPPILRTLPDPQCGSKTLIDCTRERVTSLRQLSGGFKRAAAIQPDAKPQTPADQQALESYDRWLNAKSAEAGELAAQGERALSQPDLQMSFNLQYVALQSRLQQESRSFTMVSNIMKTKHDTAKNSISNVR